MHPSTRETGQTPVKPHPGSGDGPFRTLTLDALRRRLVDLLSDLDVVIAEQRAKVTRRARNLRDKRKAAGLCKRCKQPVYRSGLCRGHYEKHLADKRVST